GAQVAELLQGRQAFARNFGELRIHRHQQIGVRPPVGTSHPAAQLIEFAQTVFLGVFHDHGVDKGNVQAILYNSSTNQNIELVAHEPEHGFFQLRLAHLAVADTDAGVRHQFLDGGGARPDRIHAIVQEVNLPTTAQFEFDRGANQL